MIKKLLSLLIVSVLLLSIASCLGVEEPRDDDLKYGTNTVSNTYVASYEEVKSSLDLITGMDFDYDERFVFLDCFEDEYDVRYEFLKIGEPCDMAQNIEEFFYGSYWHQLSWYMYIVLEEDCPLIHHMIHIGQFGESPKKAVMFTSCSVSFEITDPELLTIKNEYATEYEWRYDFLYDGEAVYNVRSCFELDDGMLEKFREAIIDAYLPATE